MSKRSDTGANVFVSYASEDRFYVDQLAGHLQEAGVEVWTDREADFGTSWPQEIRRRLDQAPAVVVVMSTASENSEWVRKEILHAERASKPILPVLLSGEGLFELNTILHEDVTSGEMPSNRFTSRLSSIVALAAAVDSPESFRDEVASLYQKLGYSVNQEIKRGRYLVDIVARRIRREAAVNNYVFCQVEAPTRHTDRQTVVRFHTKAEKLLASGECSHVTLVSSTGYSRSALKIEQLDPRIRILTVEDISSSSIADLGSLTSHVDRYEASEIARSYIDIEVAAVGTSEELPSVARASDIVRLAEATGMMPVILVADFGAGKTTIIDHINYESLSHYLADAAKRLPCRFLLKLLLDHDNLDEYVKAVTKQELGIEINLARLTELARDDKLLVLLDGFDEISSTANASDRDSYMATLAPLLFTASPTIVSSRPSYFSDYDELRKLAGRQRRREQGSDSVDRRRLREVLGEDGATIVNALRGNRAGRGHMPSIDPRRLSVEILPFSPTSIEEFLAKHEDVWQRLGFSTGRVSSYLQNTYDLTDLVSRPLLLGMLVDMIRDGYLDPREKETRLGPAKIYQIYTEAKLGVDTDKRPGDRNGLDMNARRQFAEDCAWRMHVEERLDLDAAVVAEIAGRIAPKGGKQVSLLQTAELERRLTDLRTCSFLTISDVGDLQFVHRSFQEYFAAYHLAGRLVEDDLEPFDNRLPWGVVYFLGSIAAESDDCRAALKRAVSRLGARRSGQDVGALTGRFANFISTLAYAGEIAEGLDIPAPTTVSPIVGWDFNLSKSRVTSLTIPKIERGRISFDDLQYDKLDVQSGETDAVRLRSVIGGEITLACGLTSVFVADSVGAIKIPTAARRSSSMAISVRSSIVALSLGGSALSHLKVGSGSHVQVQECKAKAVEVEQSFFTCRRRFAAEVLDGNESCVFIPGDSKSAVSLSLDSSVLLLGWSWAELEGASARSKLRLSKPGSFEITGEIRQCLVLASPLLDLASLEGLKVVDSQVLWGQVVLPSGRARSETRQRVVDQLSVLGRNSSAVYVSGSRETSPTFLKELDRVADLPLMVDSGVPQSQAPFLRTEAADASARTLHANRRVLGESSRLEDVLTLAVRSPLVAPRFRPDIEQTVDFLDQSTRRRRTLRFTDLD